METINCIIRINKFAVRDTDKWLRVFIRFVHNLFGYLVVWLSLVDNSEITILNQILFVANYYYTLTHINQNKSKEVQE